MKYAFKNLLTLIKGEKFIFSVMLASVFISAWAMTFSYGLYHHYSMLSAEEEDKGKDVSPKIADGMTLTRGDVVRYLYEISPKTLDAMQIIVASHPIMGDNGELLKSLESRVIIRDGKIIPSPYIVDLWDELNMISSGRFISDYEEANGEFVAIIENDDDVDKPYQTPNPAMRFIDDKTIIISDSGHEYKYKIVGKHTSYDITVPLLSMPEEAKIDWFAMCFEKTMTRSQYDELKAVAEEVLPGMFIFPEMELRDEESIYIYNNMMIVSVLIAALTIINFAFLYSFILGKRTRTLAIMRICGCTEGRAWGICLGECCLICIPTFIIGVLTYIPFMHNVLSEPFEFIEEAYSLPVYAILFAIYAVMLFIIMGIMLKKQTSRELAEGRKGGAI